MGCGCWSSEVIKEEEDTNKDYRLENKMEHANLPVYTYKRACVRFKRLIDPIFCDIELLKKRINFDLTDSKCPFCDNVLLDQMKVEEIKKFRNSSFDIMYRLNLVNKLIEKDETIDIFEDLKKHEEFLKKNDLREKFFRIRCRNEECKKAFMLLAYEYTPINEYLKEIKKEKYILSNWENNQKIMDEIRKEREKNYTKKKLENKWEENVYDKKKEKLKELMNLFEEKLNDINNGKINYIKSIIDEIPDDMYYENKIKLLTYIKSGIDDALVPRVKYKPERSSDEIDEKKEYFSTHKE